MAVKVKFKATDALPIYFSGNGLQFQHEQEEDVEGAQSDYLIINFPDNFEVLDIGDDVEEDKEIGEESEQTDQDEDVENGLESVVEPAPIVNDVSDNTNPVDNQPAADAVKNITTKKGGKANLNSKPPKPSSRRRNK